MTSNRLIHYSGAPLVLEAMTYPQPNDSAQDVWWAKPKGLWLSVDDAWEDWCRGEEFGFDRLTHTSEVILAPDNHVLWIKSVPAMDHFTREFGFHKNLFPDNPDHLAAWSLRRRGIDWSKVAAVYQGLIIAPYQYQRRFHDLTTWYYGWDCASGCIWDLSAIERIREVENAEVRRDGETGPDAP